MKRDTASPQLSGCLSEAVKLISSGVFPSLPAEVEEILQGIAFVIHSDFHPAHVTHTNTERTRRRAASTSEATSAPAEPRHLLLVSAEMEKPASLSHQALLPARHHRITFSVFVWMETATLFSFHLDDSYSFILSAHTHP